MKQFTQYTISVERSKAQAAWSSERSTEIDGHVADALLPLLEVPPVPWNHETQEPLKSVEEHIRPLPRRVMQAWQARAGFSRPPIPYW